MNPCNRLRSSFSPAHTQCFNAAHNDFQITLPLQIGSYEIGLTPTALNLPRTPYCSLLCPSIRTSSPPYFSSGFPSIPVPPAAKLPAICNTLYTHTHIHIYNFTHGQKISPSLDDTCPRLPVLYTYTCTRLAFFFCLLKFRSLGSFTTQVYQCISLF